jgi:hypothetical protein
MPSAEYVAWAALIVAFVAAVFTALQWASAYRSAESSQRSAVAAERSATAAEESASSTKALTALGQRPWMALEPPAVSEVQSGDYSGFTITVRADLRNSGLTPALNVRAIALFDQRPLPVTEWPLHDPTSASITVGPNLTHSLVCHPIFVTNERLQEVSEGRRVLLFVGECVYKDVLGETHRTRWCLQYYPGQAKFAAFSSDFNAMT